MHSSCTLAGGVSLQLKNRQQADVPGSLSTSFIRRPSSRAASERIKLCQLIGCRLGLFDAHYRSRNCALLSITARRSTRNARAWVATQVGGSV
jgi:hypothetical protein